MSASLIVKEHPQCPYCNNKFVFPEAKHFADKRFVEHFEMTGQFNGYWCLELICHGRHQNPPTSIGHIALTLEHGYRKELQGIAIRHSEIQNFNLPPNLRPVVLLGSYKSDVAFDNKNAERHFEKNIAVGNTAHFRWNDNGAYAHESSLILPIAHIIQYWTDLGEDLSKDPPYAHI